MLFTIAIPTYNNEKTIENAIISCINQEIDFEYEILISDDGSKDRSIEIIRNYESEYPNIRVIKNEQGSNIWMNHNRCMKKSKGDYIMFCHAGDQLYPHALKTVYEKLEQRNFPRKYVLWGHSIYKDFQQRLDRFNKNLEEMIIGEKAFRIFIDGGLTPSGTCYSRESFINIGGFINDESMIFPHSDSLTMLKLAFNGFGFEMIDSMFFEREQTSTLHLYEKSKKEQKEADEYMKKLLLENFKEEELLSLGRESTNVSFVYSYYVSKVNKKYNRIIKKMTFKKLLTKPLLLRNKYVRKIIIF